MNNTEGRIDRLEDRVDKLESIIESELGYSFGPPPVEVQTVDCDCGETFEVTVENGLRCPYCDRGSEDRGENSA